MPHPLGRLLTAMVSPFDAGGRLDAGLAAELAQRIVAAGSDGVVVNGTTGESPTLSADERLALLDAVRAALPRHAVVMGTGGNSTRATVGLTREAGERGADAALVVAPYYNKPPADGLIAHFEAVADVGLPVVLYNIPSRCGINMTAETQLRLAAHPRIVGTKEASGDLEQMSWIVAGAPDGFLLWSGDDALTLPVLSIGGHGVVSVAAHICGGALRRLIDAHVAGRVGEAAALHLRLLPVIKSLFTMANPIPVKAALEHLGVPVGPPRLPLVPLDGPRRLELGGLIDASGDLVGLPAAAAGAAAGL